MIEIFKTNVQNVLQVKIVLYLIKKEYQDAEINLDLEDCDKVLRIKHDSICKHQIMDLLTSSGFLCQLLE